MCSSMPNESTHFIFFFWGGAGHLLFFGHHFNQNDPLQLTGDRPFFHSCDQWKSHQEPHEAMPSMKSLVFHRLGIWVEIQK